MKTNPRPAQKPTTLIQESWSTKSHIIKSEGNDIKYAFELFDANDRKINAGEIRTAMQNISFDEKNRGVYEVMTELDNTSNKNLGGANFNDFCQTVNNRIPERETTEDQKLLSIFFTNKEISIKKEKIGDLLTPEGAAKPLTLTKQEIGRNIWALLHSMAASYPNEPTDEDKKQITNFMYGLENHFHVKYVEIIF